MSDGADPPGDKAAVATATAGQAVGNRRWPRLVAALAVLAVIGLGPFFLGHFWLSLGVFALAAVVGATGLNIVTGMTGQLSLAHAFFLAVGAYGYVLFADHGSTGVGGVHLRGLGLPPLLAAALAIALAGFAGLLFSPLAGRLRGLYLGVASLGLVFLGQHVLFNATTVTGGFNGRDVEPFSLFGLAFADTRPPRYIGNVRFGRLEMLWELSLLVSAAGIWYARNLQRSRSGRSLQAVRDREVAAAVMGVSVIRVKAQAFMVSSMYAGAAGVLTALAFQRIVPDTWSLALSVEFLAMIVIGGLGSVYGAAVGAIFVTALPLVLERYSDSLPFLARPGSSGVTAGIAAKFLYGAAVIAVLLFEPDGVVALGRRFRRLAGGWVPRNPGAGDPTSTDTTHDPTMDRKGVNVA